MASPGAGPGWPPMALPIEMFLSIARFLPNHSDLKAMRLVNREFNAKLTCYFLRQIVVRMGPDLNTKMDASSILHSSSTAIDFTERLLDSHVFRCFGSQIRRLALALELDERELATPSTGDLEDIVVRPWGTYRWPAQPEYGYTESDLEKTTKALEKAQGSFRLLSAAENVQELALSCEGGLGYLQGPDVNPRQPPGPPPIFGDTTAARDVDDPSLQVLFEKPYKLEMLERKLAAAGIDPVQIPVMIYQVLITEKISLEDLVREQRRRAPLPLSRRGRVASRPVKHNERLRLQPEQLTDTQKRFLFHHISAQHALVQSFLLAVLDNGATLTNLTKVNIARLPSTHIYILCRDDFWSQLPALAEVALGIVPDWRALSQSDRYTVKVTQVFPTDAIPQVFRLLNDYVGKQSRIKRLRFEWHCGGELAPGCVQRGRYILPAPFLKEHRKVIDSRMQNLLILPFITHLSLKNCWFAPNVFYRIMDTMARTESLESLELETVSLSGPPILRNAMRDRDVVSGNGYFGGDDSSFPLRQPHSLSWTHIIDMLTPGETIKERVYLEEASEDVLPLRIKKNLKLRNISFKSCGYVEVRDTRFISRRRFLNLRFPQHLRQLMETTAVEFNPRRAAVREFLQTSTDRHLAKIVPVLDPWEEFVMQHVWGFQTGWNSVYSQNIIEAAQRDGVAAPGLSRFSGTIGKPLSHEGRDACNSPPKKKAKAEDEGVDYSYDTSAFENDYNDSEGLDRLLTGFEIEAGYYGPTRETRRFPRDGWDL